MAQFLIHRPGGISNAQVIINYVAVGQPEQVYSYEELAAELSKDADREYTQKDVCQIVRKANKRLLRAHQRELYNVPNLGFRLAKASEHQHLAEIRRSKADRQIERGLLTLKNVRWEEMDENTRAAHEGTLLIMGGLNQAMQTIRKTTERHEKLIQSLLSVEMKNPLQPE